MGLYESIKNFGKKTGKVIGGGLIGLVLGLVATETASAGTAKIKIDGPMGLLEKGQTYHLYVQVDNTGLNPEKTKSVDWQIDNYPGWIIFDSVNISSRSDFFEGYSTFDMLFIPPTNSGRGAIGSGNGVQSRSWSDLVEYVFHIDSSYPGELPYGATIRLNDENIIFGAMDYTTHQPYINITPNFVINAYPGDTDLDGDVDSTDLATLGLNWSPTGTNKTWAQGDFDYDGDVDSSDLAALGLNWNPIGSYSSGIKSSSIPEPSTLGLLVLGAGAIGLKRNRRSLEARV